MLTISTLQQPLLESFILKETTIPYTNPLLFLKPQPPNARSQHHLQKQNCSQPHMLKCSGELLQLCFQLCFSQFQTRKEKIFIYYIAYKDIAKFALMWSSSKVYKHTIVVGFMFPIIHAFFLKSLLICYGIWYRVLLLYVCNQYYFLSIHCPG